jgi:hypothetical protein
MMKRPFLAALAATALVTSLATAFATCAHAQSDEPGPLVTPDGTLQFVRADHDFVGMLNQQMFDRFGANTLTHFDDDDNASQTVTRMLVQTDSGPVLYDFHHQPPTVQRFDKRMSIRRVFWQSNEVVMQGSQGWFRFKDGVLTKLQSSMTIYH